MTWVNESGAASYAGITEASRNSALGHDGHDTEGYGEAGGDGSVGGSDDDWL